MRKYLYHKQVERKRNFVGTLAAIGAAIGGALTAGSAAGAAAGAVIGSTAGVIATGASIATGVVGVTKLASGSKGSKGGAGDNSPLPLPQTPTVDAASTKAADVVSKKRAGMAASDSVYTSPLGIAGQAQVARKTLTGQ
jgi:hypothetical protein